MSDFPALLPLASDTATTIVTVAGSLAGVLVGGGVTYYGQAKLENRRETRERDDSNAKQERQQWELTIQAYAGAWSVRAEADRCTAHARDWLGNDATIEEVRAATDSMDTWRAARILFAEVLRPVEWLALVKAVEAFNAEWSSFRIEAQRLGQEATPEGRRVLLDNLKTASEGLISRNSDVVSALGPVFDLGEAAEYARRPS